MICLYRKISNKIEVCEALLRRAYLQSEQQVYIEQLLQRLTIGAEGEYQMDWFWQDLNLQEPHLLFNNFETIKFNRFKYQMDTVFICQRFVLILECKHIAGDLYYHDATNQLWREYNGQRLMLNDPFSQVMRHEEWMRQFLAELKIDLPVYTAVVFTTQSSSLNNMPERFSIFKLPGLRIKLQQMLQQNPNRINTNILNLIRQRLLQLHQPQKWQHPFKDISIRKGALCKCGQTMRYVKGKFKCMCGIVSKEPLLQGLHDYRLLVSDTITNKQFRDFFEIDNEDVVNKILVRLKLQKEGATKSRKYYIHEDIWSNKVQYM